MSTRKITSSLLAFLALIVCANSVAADATKSPQRWALLIGVNDYANVQSLKYCVADQESLANQLRVAGFPADQVYLLDDKAEKQKLRPSKLNIERQLELVLDMPSEGDTVVLSFSGHGVQIEGRSYLCPSDCEIEHPKETMISLDKVFERLGACKASLKLLIVDACRNDVEIGGKRAIDNARGLRAFGEALEKPPEGISLLTSCSPGQFAREHEKLGHGVFMHFVLEGLQGKAADDDGVVRLGRLLDYTSLKTQKYVYDQFNAAQRPYYKLEGSGPVELARIERIAPVVPAPPPKPVISAEGQRKLAQLSEKIRLNPKDAAAYSDRGDVWYSEGDNDKAIADFTEAIRQNPTEPYNYNALGNTWFAKGEYDTAIADYNEAIRIDPKGAMYYSNRGESWRFKKEFDKALENVNYAIYLDPKCESAYKSRGDTWLDRKEYDKAIASYGEALRINPKYVAVLQTRANLWDEREQYDKSLADYNTALGIDPNNASLFNERGCVWNHKEMYDQAIADFTEAIRLDPRVATYSSNRARMWENKGEHEKAIADYDQALAVDPKFKDAYDERAKILSKLGK